MRDVLAPAVVTRGDRANDLDLIALERANRGGDDPHTEPDRWAASLDERQDGVLLAVTPSASQIAAGKGMSFAVTLTNQRDVPLQYGRGGCFAYLPAGPGWDLEESCDRPHECIRAEVDPWTADVKGIDLCVVCGR